MMYLYDLEIQDWEDVNTPVEAKIVKEAPGATLANGDGDVATTGNCSGDIRAFCDWREPGESRLADCLTQQMTEEEKGNVDGKKLTEACKQELADFRIDAASNINKDVPLATACKKDAEKLCADLDFKEPSAMLACLRELKQKLSQACQDEVFQAQLEAVKDYRADAELADACEPDAEQLCADVKAGEGRVQDCLRDKRPQLSWECQEALFRQEVENADDTRLSIRLMNKCMVDKQAFCADVKPGGAKIMDCLEEHREDPHFSAECKVELEAMMERRAADFRLDAALRQLCKKDIEDLCSYEKDSMDSIAGFDARVIQCLQDHRDELVEPECKAQVHKLTQRAAQDIRFDKPLADACFEDRAKLCDGVHPGSARVIRCLQDQREELSYECRTALFDQEVRMAEDIDFKYPMKCACSAEIQKLCVGIPPGHARVIRCLQDFLDDSEMSAECKEEVQRDMIRSNEDSRLNYRLNKACQTDIEQLCSDELKYRLNKACQPDIEQLCSDECSPFLGQACGGRVLRCLTDKQDAIQSAECQTEVFYLVKMEANDFRNDVLLAEACREDVDKFCKDVEPGEGRVHECLRAQRGALSEACRKEEVKLNIIQSRDIRLRPKLNKLCSGEIAVYCKEVKRGKGRVFKCLQENLAKLDFGQQCREQVEQRTARMQEDYRLDYGVSAACEPDVSQRCAAEKGKAHGNAEVLKCLVNSFSSISEGCQREMSRAVRMALWEYKKGGALTGMCDADVGSICGKATRNPKNHGIWSIGAVGRCLSKQLAEDKPLEPACRALVAVAAPEESPMSSSSSSSSRNCFLVARLFLLVSQVMHIHLPVLFLVPVGVD
ncbi:hypothetical protein WJX72_001742 [[Myrmecia] bisecta]|uniref:Golgi apparatus protein 1 n=1 Tax=[Myrmecia] bisecta TaxID=41462 RepID=A0AAW1Q6L4_9CHLO